MSVVTPARGKVGKGTSGLCPRLDCEVLCRGPQQSGGTVSETAEAGM